MTNFFFSWRYLSLAFMGGLIAIVASLPLHPGSQPIPDPQTAIQASDRFSPAEIVSLEIDEVTRDRLRFDPAWQPIRQAIQRDIMIVKWGDGRLENPVWQQYGAKAFPLLDYYARSSDPTRQNYGIVGIRALGKPYTTLWLERQLQRNSDDMVFYLLQENPTTLLNSANYDPNYQENWQQEFGLDDAATRDRLLEIARAHLRPADAPDYDYQFNLQFIQAVTKGDPWLPPPQPNLPAPFNPALDPALGPWNQLEVLRQLTPAQEREALEIYRGLNPMTQQHLLVQRLGRMEAGRATPVQLALLRQLAADTNAPDRVWAIAELDRHGNAQGSRMLQEILNGDLKQLNPLTRSVSYEPGFWDESIESAKATHAYYLLLGMVEKYPDSRFVRGAKEYGDLTGRSYFGSELRPQAVLDRLARQTPAARSAAWVNWLSQYPDHPGADDATEFQARSLQDRNSLVAATELWVNLMTEAIGDGDATYLAYPHIRTLLDVGLTTQQLEDFVQLYQGQAIEPLFRYALAVRQARSHNYAVALQTSEGLDLTGMPADVLGSYYNKVYSRYRNFPRSPNTPATTIAQQQMQAMLTEQRDRWQQLEQLQQQNTPAARYELASNWAGMGGWKNGYLPVWDDSRTNLLPTGSWSSFYCQQFWVCNTDLRNLDEVRSSYQQASQNAIALGLYQDLLNDSQTPSDLREKTLYMSAMTLLHQWENYPLGETLRTHPLAGVPGTPIALPNDADYDQHTRLLDRVQQDYETAIDRAIAALQQDFPQSNYIDDLLFSRYALSGEAQFLQKIVQQYPQGDRAAEAEFLLAHPRPEAL